MRLIVDEETRTEYVRYGFVRDMLNLGEELPSEVIVWNLEHSISGKISFANVSCI